MFFFNSQINVFNVYGVVGLIVVIRARVIKFVCCAVCRRVFKIFRSGSCRDQSVIFLAHDAAPYRLT